MVVNKKTVRFYALTGLVVLESSSLSLSELLESEPVTHTQHRKLFIIHNSQIIKLQISLCKHKPLSRLKHKYLNIMLFEVRKSDIKNVAPRSPTPAKEMEINTKSKKAKKHKNKNSQETVHIRDLKKEGPQHDQFNYHWSCLGLCFY